MAWMAVNLSTLFSVCMEEAVGCAVNDWWAPWSKETKKFVLCSWEKNTAQFDWEVPSLYVRMVFSYIRAEYRKSWCDALDGCKNLALEKQTWALVWDRRPSVEMDSSEQDRPCCNVAASSSIISFMLAGHATSSPDPHNGFCDCCCMPFDAHRQLNRRHRRHVLHHVLVLL
jgi:hypothetical protein